jgi:chaperone required for assembly of F1-ATPase
MKRFYRDVTVSDLPGGFGLALDGKVLRTPARRALLLPTRALAEALAAEWADQGEDIRPDTMRLVALANTAFDLVADKSAEVADEAARYAGTDLLCYRAVAPESLVRREWTLWQPLLDWAADRFDAPLRVTAGIVPIEQPADSLKALRLVLDELDPLTLAAVADLTAACGSLILALALWDGRLDAAGAYEAAVLDENFQNERWGVDEEAMIRRHRLEADIQAGARFFALLRGEPDA